MLNFIGTIIGIVLASWFVHTTCFEKVVDKIYDFLHKS